LEQLGLSFILNHMAEDQLLYVGQKAFVEKAGKVLVVMDPDLGLDFPDGKIQEGETDFFVLSLSAVSTRKRHLTP
jgi:hypothetical protein